MDATKQYIIDNKEWLFPVFAALAAITTWLFRRLGRPSGPLVESNGQHAEANVTNNITIHGPAQVSKSDRLEASLGDAKERVGILFIDDDTGFKIVSMLRKAGWRRVSIVADIDRVDHEKVKSADIIFVDVQGVGKKLGFDREGLGLLKAIKTKYPAKKAVIYSAVPLHDIFADEIDHADGRLKKTAEFIQFEQKIEELAR